MKKSPVQYLCLCVLVAWLVTAPLSNAWAQSATCAANEPTTSHSYLTAGNAWAAGSLTYNGTAGTVNILATASGVNWQSGYPVSGAQIGGTTNALTLQVDRPNATVSDTVTFTFSKPVNNLSLTVSDLDYFNVSGQGAYNDQVRVSGTNINGGTVLPTASAASNLVTVSGNTAYASSSANNTRNCAPSSAQCNATFNFSQPVTSIAMIYENTTASNWAYGNPPAQAIGLTFAGFCTQNGQTLNLAKTWVQATSGHGASAATSSDRVPTAALPAANATFSSTATTNTNGAGVQVFPGETLTLPAETFSGGANSALYGTTVQCTGGTTLASGAVGRTITIGNGNTATTCTYTNTGREADLAVVKTRTPTGTLTVGQTINYTLVVTNNGPATATGAVITDTPQSGLSCPAGNTVSCSGPGCPAATTTVGTLTAGWTLGTLTSGQSVTLTFSCTTQ